ncbi:MAG: hypothetical protein HND48_08355 [Chloroflexi bacterium]|nr:hypothetical protein [Chloroflexota bacterium]
MSLWIFTPEQIREIEKAAVDAGYTVNQMMQDAGREIAARAVSMLDGISSPRITVLVGKGNNGGDGLVAAALLSQMLPDSDSAVPPRPARRRSADAVRARTRRIRGLCGRRP